MTVDFAPGRATRTGWTGTMENSSAAMRASIRDGRQESPHSGYIFSIEVT